MVVAVVVVVVGVVVVVVVLSTAAAAAAAAAATEGGATWSMGLLTCRVTAPHEQLRGPTDDGMEGIRKAIAAGSATTSARKATEEDMRSMPPKGSLLVSLGRYRWAAVVGGGGVSPDTLEQLSGRSY